MKEGIIGLDIGGANLKAAHSNGVARTRPFAVWKQPGKLAKELAALLGSMPPANLLAVTMTAELCDCYLTKREGVNAVLAAVQSLGNYSITVWQNDGEFVTVAKARKSPLKTASANWLALATFAGRFAPTGPALLIDIGSTTMDVIPLQDGVPVPRGRTDLERLQTEELRYMGVRRTSIGCLLDRLYWRDHWIAGARELFATTRDAYLVLGDLPEDPTDSNTADGRPATRRFAHARLARMLCADTDNFTRADAEALASQVRERQLSEVLDAAGAFQRRSRKRDPNVIITAGSGEFLVRAAFAQYSQDWQPPLFSLKEVLGPKITEAACAYALAVLAAERFAL